MPLPKLVRDKIPEIIRNIDKKNPRFRELSRDEYEQELLKKLTEEVQEVIDANGETERMEELADIMEVIIAIASLEEKSLDEVEVLRKKKFDERGGFAKRILLESIE